MSNLEEEIKKLKRKELKENKKTAELVQSCGFYPTITKLTFNNESPEALVELKDREGMSLVSMSLPFRKGDSVVINEHLEISPFVLDLEELKVSSNNENYAMQKEADIIVDVIKKMRIWNTDEYEYLIDKFNGESIESNIRGDHIVTAELNDTLLIGKLDQMKSNKFVREERKQKDYTRANRIK